MQYIRLLLFYSVIFQSFKSPLFWWSVIFQSCKFQSPKWLPELRNSFFRRFYASHFRIIRTSVVFFVCLSLFAITVLVEWLAGRILSRICCSPSVSLNVRFYIVPQFPPIFVKKYSHILCSARWHDTHGLKSHNFIHKFKGPCTALNSPPEFFLQASDVTPFALNVVTEPAPKRVWSLLAWTVEYRGQYD